MTPSAPILSTTERATLEAVCDALVPALAADADDTALLFALNGSAVGLAWAVEQAIGAHDDEAQRQLRRLLRMLEHPLTMRVLARRGQPFSALPQPDRERALLALATNPASQLRSGFQALKRLATFLFYSMTDEDGTNPTWPVIGYTPSSNPPAPESRLVLTSVTEQTTLEYDVCVIGSGAGGGVVAGELAATGKRVLVLEAGGGYQPPSFDQHELVGMQRLYLDGGMTATRDLSIAILAGGALGGGTTVNWQSSFRLPDAVREEWAAASGCRFFAEESFTASLDAVSARLHVSRDESIVNANNEALRRGCAELGYHWSVIPRNASGCDPEQCGHCVFGCRHGGKQSTPRTYLYDAQRNGNTTIIAGCRVDQISIVNGRVRGVEAIATDPQTGQEYTVTVQAPVVVVAAGAIHSPTLLIRSGVTLPALGQNLFLHPTSGVAGTYDDRIESWYGPPQTIVCDHFADLEGGYGLRVETAPAHPGLLAMSVPWFGARDHRRRMQQAAHMASLIVLVRDRNSGRVRLNQHGQPMIEYRPGKQEQTLLKRGIADAARIHLAAGAREILTLHTRAHQLQRTADVTDEQIDAFCQRLGRAAIDRNWSLLYSAHQMGTCRMGTDARSAVCNPDGEVFGVQGLFVADASAFPLSSGVNPMLTVMALAHHTAQRIKAT